MDERRSIALLYPSLWECYTLVLRHHHPRAAQSWLAELRETVILLKPAPEDYESTLRHVARYRDQPITIFDALLAVMSDRFALPVWTFDLHFDMMGVSVRQ